MFENKFQILFYKVYSLISKGLFSNHISIIQIKPFGQLIKFSLKLFFIMKSVFLTIHKCCVEFWENLQIGLNYFVDKIKGI
jgi:hypothetical protein